ncbi:MAG TPA: hypothetical protein PK147_10150 [Saprospiraceae bacterium]|nr:hypothetical protein [Saprospiraceae bacterium]
MFSVGSPVVNNEVQLLLDTYHLDIENEAIDNVLKTNIFISPTVSEVFQVPLV